MRDTVEADVVAALRAAGIDPTTGKTSQGRDGVKRPDMFDWFGAVTTSEATTARSAAGAELERLGWAKGRERGELVKYTKGDWWLMVAVSGRDKELSAYLQEGQSMLVFTAAQRISAEGDGDAS
ncbi:hypothetical protein ACFY7H_24920 [Streptomyces sp. NPDC012794]|uniref:hypothetical protein n=1 Tax=Streptomyces sp. NPDC012794 TaxID=3364850 RepID=UPI0036C6D89A